MNQALLDTGILIRYLRGQPQAREMLERLDLQGIRLFLSVMTGLELWIGCRNRPDEIAKVDELISEFQVVIMDEEISRKAARLIYTYPQVFGPELSRGTADAIIAASAWEKQAPLYTLNTRQFLKTDLNEVEVIAISQSAEVWM